MTEDYEKGKRIVQKLLDSKHQAFFVGGFVRDRLLGIDVSDIDITTDALPEEVMEIFDTTKATGLKYGTVTVFEGDKGYEVTTFRTDGTYENHRKPSSVRFSSTLNEDLKRRDFTINALAMDIDSRIIDLFSGQEDLAHHLIRAIGDPDQRFNEDALRILRAFRFVSKLSFDIEEKTFDSLRKNMPLLAKIANERTVQEFKKIFSYPAYTKAIRLMDQAQIGAAFPELEKGIHHLSTRSHYTLGALGFFAFCFYMNHQEIPETWRFSNKEKAIMEKVMELVNVMENDVYNEMIIYRLGKDIPLLANRVSMLLDPSNDQSQRIRDIYKALPIKHTCDLAFKGDDILRLTELKNAEIIGDIIDELTLQVITRQLPNDYEALKSYTMHILENTYGKR